MSRKYDKKEDLKEQIFNDLLSINSISEAAYRYIIEPHTVYDIDELKCGLLAVKEYTDSITNNVYELMDEFYHELEEKENE